MRIFRGSFQTTVANRRALAHLDARRACRHASLRAGDAPSGERRRAMLRTKSKNDPSARGQAGEDKTFEGKKVKPVLYVGTAVGHGRYIAAQDESGKLIMGRDGQPIAFRDI
jgi:hypothetical protein